MAQKRMFSKVILDADKFMDMPAECQALYFHLAMKADDEGFGAGPNKMLKMLDLDKGHLQKLEQGGFIYLFDSGVYLVRHWHIHNRIRKDRAGETIYQQEKSKVAVDDTGVYIMSSENKQKPVSHKCQAHDGQMPAQEREGKNRLDKISSGKERRGGEGSLCREKLKKLLESASNSFPYAVTVSAFDKYTDKMEFECIDYAFREAKTAGKHSLGYVRAVLDRLLGEGIVTKSALESRCRNSRNGPYPDEEGFASRYAFEKDELLERMERL